MSLSQYSLTMQNCGLKQHSFIHSYINSFSFQLSCWFEELKQELASNDIADSVEGAEDLLAQFNQQREATIDASINTISEGENLLLTLRYVGLMSSNLR